MADWIRREEVLDIFYKHHLQLMGINGKTFIELIKEIPTSYDVETVEEQLKQQAEQYSRRAEEHRDYADYHARYWAKKCSYEHALEIVRNGRKDVSVNAMEQDSNRDD